jgi:hypothetical protein
MVNPQIGYSPKALIFVGITNIKLMGSGGRISDNAISQPMSISQDSKPAGSMKVSMLWPINLFLTGFDAMRF